VPSGKFSFRPFVSDKEHGYNILSQKVEDAGSMASSHQKPHKELDPLSQYEVVNFLYILRITLLQPIIFYHTRRHVQA